MDEGDSLSNHGVMSEGKEEKKLSGIQPPCASKSLGQV